MSSILIASLCVQQDPRVVNTHVALAEKRDEPHTVYAIKALLREIQMY
jgi:hypothetical protein